MTLLQLDEKVLNNCLEYTQLDISGLWVPCPYAMNIIEGEFLKLMKEAKIPEEMCQQVHKLYKENNADYGWYRGKGSASEIAKACVDIASARNFSLESATLEGIRIFMNFVGLGVDCSGYLYNVLYKAFEEFNMEQEFTNSLNWADKEKQGVSKASVDIFAGNASDEIPSLSDLRPLDLILYKSVVKDYSHIVMLVQREDRICATQSTLTSVPNGVRIDSFGLIEGRPFLDCSTVLGKTFEQRFDEGLIEFRRLKITNNLDDTGIEPVTSTMSM